MAQKPVVPTNQKIDMVAGILKAIALGMNKKKPAGPAPAQNTNISGCGGCSVKK
jgi:hypothetical protein